MGNRSSSQPQPPPAALSAAVMGDVAKFQAAWKVESDRLKVDSQDNNVLHALFSCPPKLIQSTTTIEDDDSPSSSQILTLIHDSLDRSQLSQLYQAQNTLGCTPLWILMAYGNVPLFQQVQAKLQALNAENDCNLFDLVDMIRVPNRQGDTALLATCSKGNVAMVQTLAGILKPAAFLEWLQQANAKGTTPLQIAVGNGHLDLLQYILEQFAAASSNNNSQPSLLQQQLCALNPAGLSLFHICSERNFAAGLKALLTAAQQHWKKSDSCLESILALKDKNQANAVHVACYCGNLDVVQVWIETAASFQWLDATDGEGRSAYWLAMLQGHQQVGEALQQAGVDTQREGTTMLADIQRAEAQRLEQAAKRKERQQQQMINGPALLQKQ